MKKYVKIGKACMVLNGSSTRICIKQPKVSQTKSFLEKEVLERFIEEYFLLPIYKLQSRKSPMIPNKG